MTILQSESMATDYVLNGATNIDQLTDKERNAFAVQLFEEEASINDKVSMLVDSHYFNQIPDLLISFATPQNPHPSNDVRSDAINSLLKDSVRDTLSNTLLKCLVDMYTLRMNQLLEYGNNDLHEMNQSQHDDHLYTQHMESQL